MKNYYYGCDYSVINAARVSFNRDKNSASPIKDLERDKKLFTFLYEHGHYSVFEHTWFYINENNLPESFKNSYFNPDSQIFRCAEYYIFSGRTLFKLFTFLNERTKEEIRKKFPALTSVIERRNIEELSDKHNIIDAKIAEITDCGSVNLVDYFIFKECPKYSIYTFVIECPIFVARQWMRHRFGSYNELSRRYTKSDIKYYLPEYNIMEDELLDEEFKNRIKNLYLYIDNLYKEMIEKGTKKEVARIVLPVSTYTRFYWTVFKTSIDNFLRLRAKDEAQYEIRTLAKAVEKIVSDIYE